MGGKQIVLFKLLGFEVKLVLSWLFLMVRNAAKSTVFSIATRGAL